LKSLLFLTTQLTLLIIRRLIHFGKAKDVYTTTLQILSLIIFSLLASNCLANSIHRNIILSLKYEEGFDKDQFNDSSSNKKVDTSHPVKVHAGGEIRSRYERYWNDNWGAAPKDNNGYFLHRVLIHGDLHVGRHLQFFSELKSAFHSGLNIPPRPVDEDKLDLQQLFLNYTKKFENRSLIEIKVGRQQFSLGSKRLIDDREYTNALLSFDGISISAVKNARSLTAFAFRQSRLSFGVFDNIPDKDRNLWGIYLKNLLGGNVISSLDFYYIGQQKRKISYTIGDFTDLYNQGPFSEIRHTFGTRFLAHSKRMDFELEPIYQVGVYSDRNQKISAWRIAAIIGDTIKISNQPFRLFLNADASSGDTDSADGKLNTFLSPYPDILDPTASNLTGFKTGIEFTLKKLVSFKIFEWLFWRTSVQDGIYGFLGFPYRKAGNSGVHYIGNSPTVIVSFQILQHITITALYATEFVNRGFFHYEKPGDDLTYVGLGINFKY
jgi:hypothetical protein